MDLGPDARALGGIALGALAAVFLNVGKGVQKMKVQVLRRGREALAEPHRRDLAIWALGVAMTGTATGLYSLALKYAQSPSVVSALTGVGLLGLAAFAAVVLRERLGGPQWAGVLLILLGTTVLSSLHRPAKAEAVDVARLTLAAAAALAPLAALALFAWRTGRLWGGAFGLLGGTCMAIAMVLGEVALAAASRSFVGQFRTPYVYIGLFTGTSALVFSNIAYLRAEALVVVPVFNASAILFPLALEVALRGLAPAPAQLAATAAIAAGVVALTAFRAAPAPAPSP